LYQADYFPTYTKKEVQEFNQIYKQVLDIKKIDDYFDKNYPFKSSNLSNTGSDISTKTKFFEVLHQILQDNIACDEKADSLKKVLRYENDYSIFARDLLLTQTKDEWTKIFTEKGGYFSFDKFDNGYAQKIFALFNIIRYEKNPEAIISLRKITNEQIGRIRNVFDVSKKKKKLLTERIHKLKQENNTKYKEINLDTLTYFSNNVDKI
jgi:hypothetical protein